MASKVGLLGRAGRFLFGAGKAAKKGKKVKKAIKALTRSQKATQKFGFLSRASRKIRRKAVFLGRKKSVQLGGAALGGAGLTAGGIAFSRRKSRSR